MAYVRFSSDGFRSDVYVYDDVAGGVTVHIAAQRFESDRPRPEMAAVPATDREAYISALLDYHSAISTWCYEARRVRIDLPDAGKTFNFTDASEAAQFLESLALRGYVVPTFAIQSLRDDSDHP